jgi:hypothetical protein
LPLSSWKKPFIVYASNLLVSTRLPIVSTRYRLPEVPIAPWNFFFIFEISTFRKSLALKDSLRDYLETLLPLSSWKKTFIVYASNLLVSTRLPIVSTRYRLPPLTRGPGRPLELFFYF